MPAPVPAGSNIRDQLMDALEADSALTELLADGATSVLPRRGVDPNKARTPFALVRYEGGGQAGEADPEIGTWAVEIHDKPGYGLVSIDAAVLAIKRRLRNADWARNSAGGRAYRSEWAGATGELVDQGYGTIKRIARIRVIAR